MNAVDRTDVWVIERRQQSRFPLEAGATIRIGRPRSGQTLERDVAPERRIAGLVDFAHAADTEDRENSVRPDLATDERRRRRHLQWLVAEACGAGAVEMCQQRFDVGAKRLVALRELQDRSRALVDGPRELKLARFRSNVPPPTLITPRDAEYGLSVFGPPELLPANTTPTPPS